MTLRSIFNAGRDAFRATEQLDGVTTREQIGMTAAPAIAAAQNTYWRHKGQWVLDLGDQSPRQQENYDDWRPALATAYALPEDEQTADVMIRLEGYTGGGVNVFDKENPEPVVARLEQMEQETRQGKRRDAGRHELGAEDSPTGRLGWQMHQGKITHVTRLDEADVPAARASIRRQNKILHPVAPIVRDAKAEGRDVKRAVTRRRHVTVLKMTRRP